MNSNFLKPLDHCMSSAEDHNVKSVDKPDSTTSSSTVPTTEPKTAPSAVGYNPWENPDLYNESGYGYAPVEYNTGSTVQPSSDKSSYEAPSTSSHPPTNSDSGAYSTPAPQYFNPNMTCRTCGGVGHMMKNCPEQYCGKCRGFGHNFRDCTFSVSRLDEGETDSIIITNFPQNATTEDALAHFSQIGVIRKKKGKGKDRLIERDCVSVYPNPQSTGASKVECVIGYDDPQTAPVAVQWFHGTCIVLSLRVKSACIHCYHVLD